MDNLTTEMSSRNHSYLQARLAKLLDDERYTVFTELSLDVGSLGTSGQILKDFKEPKPDVCLYPFQKIDLLHDVIRMKEMPLLAVEILSPMQGMQIILDKFQVYFQAGIKSCWLVVPPIRSVSVFSPPDKEQTFSGGDVIDEVLGIRLPMGEIFK